MKIVVTGTRGIPGIQGGVETHCEELYPRIADKGHEIIVVRRPEYLSEQNRANLFKGVHIKDIQSIRSKHFEAIFHTIKAAFFARKIKADIIHIHAVGPSLAVPLARLLGLKVVMTHHGEDYNRHKWGRMAKAMLRIGEWLGVRYANHVIVISEGIQSMLRQKMPSRKNITLIHNGVNIPVSLPSDTSYLTTLGLEKHQYILAVGRLVEEKRFDLLIEAFKEFKDSPDIKLVIAGDSDHQSAYADSLKKLSLPDRIIFTGFVKGEQLSQLYANAGLFVLPSSHEGLPIALLEAMSYRCRILASDIPANLEVGLPSDCYFSSGDVDSLQQGIGRQLDNACVDYDLSKYDWEEIASRTEEVYKMVVGADERK